MKKSMLMLAAVSWAMNLLSGENPLPGRGQAIFERRCTGCHALDHVKAGPPLRGVWGRRAAAVAKFPYSEGLRRAGLKWDDTTLDRWLTDPDSVVPGNDMSFRLENAEERAAVIAFLRQQTGR